MVALVPAIINAAAMASLDVGHGWSGGAVVFGQELAVLCVIPVLWLLIGGAWIDHRRSDRGAGHVLGIHLVSVLGATWIAFVLGGLVGEVFAWGVGDPPEAASLVFYSFLMPVWVGIGFVFALTVPGSFPPRSRAVPPSS